jgi:hypothetical protein
MENSNAKLKSNGAQINYSFTGVQNSMRILRNTSLFSLVIGFV